LSGGLRRGGAIVTVSALLLAGPAYGALRIEGVGGDVETVVRAFLTLEGLRCETPRWWVERAYNRMPGEARQALETLGFYQSTFETEIGWTEECWEGRLVIIRGDPVRISAVTLEVDPPLGSEPAMLEALGEQPLRTGRAFSHQGYEGAKSRLLEVAEDLGYFDARYVRHVVQVDAAENTAEVDLSLEGGRRYHVGEIHVDQTTLRPRVFERMLRIEEGAPFDANDLVATYRNLLASEYFGRVLVAPELDARDEGRVPILVSAAPGTRRSLLLGAGYATDTGPRIRGDLHYRRLNDRGHRASFTSLVSAVKGEVRAQYRLPYGDPASEWLYAETRLVYEETDTYENVRRGVGVGRTHLRWRDWTETNYVDYSVEDFEVADQDGRSHLMLIGTNWTRRTLAEEPRPVTGWSLSLDVRGAAQALLSDNDLIQSILHARQILPLGPRFRLLGRVSAGWTWQQEFEDLPPSIRFFAGGDNSVRGYGYETLGPEEDGAVVGGKRLLTGSLELDALVRQNWSVALFADAGSAFNDKPDFSRGVGIGVRWYSPLGPLRLDIAHPLDDPDSNFRFHVSLGPDL
jgi:translocation and assembly module TamA